MRYGREDLLPEIQPGYKKQVEVLFNPLASQAIARQFKP